MSWRESKVNKVSMTGVDFLYSLHAQTDQAGRPSSHLTRPVLQAEQPPLDFLCDRRIVVLIADDSIFCFTAIF